MTSPDGVIEIRPNPLRDITDEPMSDISRYSWHSRQPIIIVDFQPLSGGPPIRRALRLVREMAVEWIHLQKDVFSFAFVQCEEGGSACVIDLWQTLVVTVKKP